MWRPTNHSAPIRTSIQFHRPQRPFDLIDPFAQHRQPINQTQGRHSTTWRPEDPSTSLHFLLPRAVRIGQLRPAPRGGISALSGKADKFADSTSKSSSTPRRSPRTFPPSRRLVPVLLPFSQPRSSSAPDAATTMTTTCSARRRSPATASLTA